MPHGLDYSFILSKMNNSGHVNSGFNGSMNVYPQEELSYSPAPGKFQILFLSQLNM